MTPSVAVVTIAHGRHDHLRGQLHGLASGTRGPDLHVVVAMDDPDLEGVVDGELWPWPGHVVHVPRVRGHLPLALARNRGVADAARAGCEQLVLLDVDCIPGPDLLRRYSEVLAKESTREGAPTVLSGEVRYLPPLPPGADPRHPDRLHHARPHPARPVVADGLTVPEPDVRLFWSLSFAVTARDWGRVGGFDEAYLGYGGEDTDFGERLAAAGGRLHWVGGAPAFHQHHDTESPPLRHLTDIVRNANLFATRWGWWPMEGWLTRFEESGLVARRPDGTWHVLASAPPAHAAGHRGGP